MNIKELHSIAREAKKVYIDAKAQTDMDAENGNIVKDNVLARCKAGKEYNRAFQKFQTAVEENAELTIEELKQLYSQLGINNESFN